jgi:hypothetical protein
MTYEYVTNLHGAPAVAVVTYEELYSYVLMAGRIESAQAAYSFHADIYDDGGYGEMLDEQRGERFRIQIQNLNPNGFILTSNPLLSPTDYYFRRASD